MKIIGTGIFNWDSIFVRKYPQGPQHNRIFDEKLVVEEVGGTCGNVMCMLAHFGWETFPVTNLDRSEEGLGMTQSLKDYGCDCRFVTNTDKGGTTILTIRHGLSMAHGIPVIAFDVGGVREWLTDFENGVVIPEKHTVAAAGILGGMAQNPAWLESMGQRGLELAREKFSEEKFIEKFKQLPEVLQ